MVLLVGKSNVDQVKHTLSDSYQEFYEIGHVVRAAADSKIKFLNEHSLFNRNRYTVQRKRVKVAIMISGTGTNMKKLIERSRAPDSNCEVSRRYWNQPESKVIFRWL